MTALEVVSVMHMAKIGESCSCQNRQNDKRHPENNIAHFSLPFSASLTYLPDKGKTYEMAAGSRNAPIVMLSTRKSSFALKDSSFRLQPESAIGPPLLAG